PPADAEYRLLFAANQLARCLLPALTLHLFLVFPSPPEAADAAAGDDAGHGRATATPPRRRRAWVPFLYLPAAALTALHLDLTLASGRCLTGRRTAALLGTLDRVDLLHLVGFGIAAIFVLIYRLLNESGWERRRQLHWMILGLAGGYLPFLALYTVPFGL